MSRTILHTGANTSLGPQKYRKINEVALRHRRHISLSFNSRPLWGRRFWRLLRRCQPCTWRHFSTHKNSQISEFLQIQYVICHLENSCATVPATVPQIDPNQFPSYSAMRNPGLVLSVSHILVRKKAWPAFCCHRSARFLFFAKHCLGHFLPVICVGISKTSARYLHWQIGRQRLSNQYGKL